MSCDKDEQKRIIAAITDIIPVSSKSYGYSIQLCC